MVDLYSVRTRAVGSDEVENREAHQVRDQGDRSAVRRPRGARVDQWAIEDTDRVRSIGVGDLEPLLAVRGGRREREAGSIRREVRKAVIAGSGDRETGRAV